MRIAAAPTQPKKLTVLYFIDGKNNLSPLAEHSYDSLLKEGSDDNVNLVTQVGFLKKDVQRGLVSEGELKDAENLGKTDMGSPKSVKDFVKWGMQKYPAEKYMVVLWNHGSGFKGVLADDEHNSMCNNKELARALEEAQAESGKKIDVLNFNACLMSQGEVAYEYRNAAKYLVGSEEVEAGLRIPIPGLYGTTPQAKVVSDIKAVMGDAKELYQRRGDLSAEQLARLFVYESKHQLLSSMFSPSQAALDLSKMEAVRGACEGLASQVLAGMEQDPTLRDRLRSAISDVQHYASIDAHLEPYVDYRDLGDFTRALTRMEGLPQEVKESARKVQKSLTEAVVCEQHATTNLVGRSMDGSTGMSVYLPTDYGFDRKGTNPVDGTPIGSTHKYEKTSWGENSQWEKMLKKLAVDDDTLGKIPKSISGYLSNVGQISRLMGYGKTWSVADGASSAFHWSLNSVVSELAGVGGLVGGIMRTDAGISNLKEAITREDSPNRLRLGIEGAVDTAVGLGVGLTCGAALVGATSAGLGTLAMGSMILAGSRLALRAGEGLVDTLQASSKSVEEKLAETQEMKPRFDN